MPPRRRMHGDECTGRECSTRQSLRHPGDGESHASPIRPDRSLPARRPGPSALRLRRRRRRDLRVPRRRPGFARVAVAPEGSRPEVVVVGVVPRPGVSPWGGAVVMLDYSRLERRRRPRAVVAVRGRPAPSRTGDVDGARAGLTSPSSSRGAGPARPGTHTFRARLGTTGGGSVAYEWTTTAALTGRLALVPQRRYARQRTG